MKLSCATRPNRWSTTLLSDAQKALIAEKRADEAAPAAGKGVSGRVKDWILCE